MRNNPLRRVRKVEDKQLHDAGSMAGALGTRSVEDGGADGVTFIDQAWVADGVRALARQINRFGIGSKVHSFAPWIWGWPAALVKDWDTLGAKSVCRASRSSERAMGAG
ncbi:hypothetical protein JCM18916_206 [Cutibacterium acnes JCM 18916]|nr:hypothetical protein JCM18916_206 [Cutibacterium acnes JCM 18916]